jgi:hypothetical protein
VALLLALSAPAFAQVGRDIRFVSADAAEVRSGASDNPNFYVTNRLKRGQPVEVVGEMPGGWLAIRPPEGSFSYINTRFLTHPYPDVPNYVVTLDGVKVPVFVGSEVVNKRPTVRGAELERGTQVSSRGRPITDEEGTWMPIDSPARERRYIKASEVSRTVPTPGAAAGAVVHATATPGASASAALSPAGLATSSAPSANPPPTPAQLWQQAQQADRCGQVNEAIRLYARFASEATQSHPTHSAWALQRANFLRNGYQNYGGPTGYPAPTAGRVYALPASSAGGGLQVGPPTTARAASSPADVTRTTTIKRDSSAFVPQAPTGAPPRLAPGSSPSSWQGYKGVLRRAGRVVEGQTTYALDDPVTLRPVLYASPGAGVNLEGYLNREVELWGYTVYRGDLKNNHMTATRVVPVQ